MSFVAFSPLKITQQVSCIIFLSFVVARKGPEEILPQDPTPVLGLCALGFPLWAPP